LPPFSEAEDIPLGELTEDERAVFARLISSFASIWDIGREVLALRADAATEAGIRQLCHSDGGFKPPVVGFGLHGPADFAYWLDRPMAEELSGALATLFVDFYGVWASIRSRLNCYSHKLDLRKGGVIVQGEALFSDAGA
jgi:hypothetical protein